MSMPQVGSPFRRAELARWARAAGMAALLLAGHALAISQAPRIIMEITADG